MPKESAARQIKLTTRTGVSVNRTLPHRDLKMIGAWCFVDHFGPTEQTDGMVVAAHPHTGLQTVTWLLEGAIEHRDSIGSVQEITPGQLNLMTAGYGISHSELSRAEAKSLHAVQLWVALPNEARNVAPAFEHRDDLPVVLGDGWQATILVGEFMGKTAKTRAFSPILGLELRIQPNISLDLPVFVGFEYGLLNLGGSVVVNGLETPLSGLTYFSRDDAAAGLTISAGSEVATALILAGEPFGEQILMWWNFIARNHEEIVEQREQWNGHLENEAARARFGEFDDEIGGWIPAPELPSVQLHSR